MTTLSLEATENLLRSALDSIDHTWTDEQVHDFFDECSDESASMGSPELDTYGLPMHPKGVEMLLEHRDELLSDYLHFSDDATTEFIKLCVIPDMNSNGRGLTGEETDEEVEEIYERELAGWYSSGSMADPHVEGNVTLSDIGVDVLIEYRDSLREKKRTESLGI